MKPSFLARGGVCAVIAATSACFSPGGYYEPTRTPREGTASFSTGVEVTKLARSPDPTATASGGYSRFLPRPRPGVSYGVTDRVALHLGGTFFYDAVAGVTVNPLRSRYVDLSLALRGGYEICQTVAEYSSDWCERNAPKAAFETGALGGYFLHGSAVGLLGLNASSWLTTQLQIGAIARDEPRGAVSPWLGATMLFSPDDHVALGPNLLVLPDWLPSGQTLIAPALVVVAHPGRSNPYRP